ncbi:prolyl-tRNA synthetase [Fibrobacter sp. UWH9]|uniref:proline--tRNA ligase n=1 Tax=unclassified Fibrobacter TaxID=2634177 RepID=UPI00091CCA0A|nr:MULTISPECIES: proline--tRNA ligase [unclassified Fibrobacter]OWV08167.1 proline--tRNA ligase [Fibrobacter sp. UWH3]SHG95168.1 prolyl-tRNA synthetase [Fibrobacter sp. UWH9]SHK68075.1 prolyl-tRNA synthetase [Fibrobacter sp. UWH6]
MKLSKYFYVTLRETPSDATMPSHIFLMRGGYIKPVSTGIYSMMPMGFRVIQKITNIVREEMNKIGGIEVDLPVVQTADLWSESGRYQAIGEELLRFKDRNNHNMVLAMTHEEAMTDMARYVLNSYKQLPFMLYQFKTKYRDEARARGGLIRVREFLMKDAYSFHSSQEDLDKHYQEEYDAYLRIYRRVGIEPVVVQSDTGIMGGKVAHEFMLDTPNGEDYLILCKKCGYQANREIAKFTRETYKGDANAMPEKVETPHCPSIEELSAFLKIDPKSTAKCVFFDFEGKLITVMVPGNLDVSEIKLHNLLKAKELYPADDALIKSCGMVPGFASPIGAHDTRIIVDEALADACDLVMGANEENYHLLHCTPKRDFPAFEVADIAEAQGGCKCPSCGGELSETRGIELGNIFKLGTKFSESMGAKYLTAEKTTAPAIMGCYGIGIGRLMASVVENSHDDFGPIWPKSIAPFQVEIVPIGKEPELVELAEKFEAELEANGIDVLVDDRDERPGVKFKDADLWGSPVRIAIGKKGLANGEVEWKFRNEKEFTMVKVEDVVAKAKEYFAE